MHVQNRAIAMVVGRGGPLPSTIWLHEHPEGYVLVIDEPVLFVPVIRAPGLIAVLQSAAAVPIRFRWKAGRLHWVRISGSAPASDGRIRLGVLQWGIGASWSAHRVDAGMLHRLAMLWSRHLEGRRPVPSSAHACPPGPWPPDRSSHA